MQNSVPLLHIESSGIMAHLKMKSLFSQLHGIHKATIVAGVAG